MRIARGRDLHLFRRSVFCLVKLVAALKTGGILPTPHFYIFQVGRQGGAKSFSCLFGGWWWLVFPFFFSPPLSCCWSRFAGAISLHISLYMLQMCTLAHETAFTSYFWTCLLDLS